MATLLDKAKKLPKVLLIISGYFIVIVVIVIISIISINTQANHDILSINNYNKVVENLSDTEHSNILSMLSYTLKLNTDKEPSAIEDVNIRDDSYTQEQIDDIFYTSFIVDIPSIQQSYKIVSQFRDAGMTGDYNTQARCVFDDDLIYAPFKCRDRISEENNLPWADPIQYNMPIVDNFFQISLRGGLNKVGLVIRINMPEPTRENNIKAAEYYKTQARQKIESFGYPLANYEIFYTWLR